MGESGREGLVIRSDTLRLVMPNASLPQDTLLRMLVAISGGRDELPSMRGVAP